VTEVTDENSVELMQRAERLMPGGVNSPVRAFRAVGGNPPFIARARGARIHTAGGQSLIDYVGSWGPAILGHAHPGVVAAVRKAAENGLSYGAPTELEVQFAEVVQERYPCLEMMRCVSSGTEATMSALRVARGFTHRDVIVKFNGGYHGHADALLVKAGSGAATFGAPDSAGVPAAAVELTAALEYNDTSGLQRFFADSGDRVAAVIVEPVAGNMGCVPPEDGFLQTIVDLCDAHGALSVFDEVMTGCRVSRGGAQERYGVRPHMTCLGKVVGGGLPLAVYGGRADVMRMVAPLGPVYQAGTLSGNPLAVTAGLTTLAELVPEVYARLEARGARLQAGIEDAISRRAVSARVQRVGSMLTVFFRAEPVRSYRDASASDTARFARWHGALLARGVYWPPSQFEAAFISAAHTEEDIDQTVAAIDQALAA
jgi:glutamate-1-semialdehyde 2,1-aminomutase